MAAKAWDLSLCAAFAVATVALAFAGTLPAAARTPLGAPLVLVLAGWAMTAALRPGRGLPLDEHLTYAVALSIATAVLGGLILNAMPWGLRARPWAVYEGGVTIACCALALLRGYERRPSGAWAATLPGVRPAFLLIAAVAVVVVAVAAARTGAVHDMGAPFTQLSMVPVVANGGRAATLRIENHESHAETYDLRLMQGAAVLREWPALALVPGAGWQATVPLAQASDPTQPLYAYLYRAEAPDTPYRTVYLTPGAK